ncbi:MAG TPA: septum formation initiator family protein [Candidatus Dormibacteraeota bacterium]|nr:septum formation initiator family protein [Candidatus Dormibacteraeota bacterium]
MQNKLKKYYSEVESFVLKLGDIHYAGQLLFVILILLISWSGVKSIQTNYDLQKQIAELQQQNSVQSLENNNLQLQNEYYNTNQYLELSARQNFGLGLNGEQEVIVPKNVALSYTVNYAQVSSQTNVLKRQPTYQYNLQAWVNFFLHRPQNVSAN